MAEKTAKKVTTEAKASEKENIFKRIWKWICVHKWWLLGIGGTAAVSGTGGYVAGRMSKKSDSEEASVDVTSCTTAEDSVEE